MALFTLRSIPLLENGVRTRLSYTYQETEEEQSGLLLTNSPCHVGKVNLSAPLLQRLLAVGVELQYMGRRRTLSSGDTDDFFLMNLSLFSQKLIDSLEISASIYNVFDEVYSDPGAGELVQDAIEQDGRSFRLRLSYHLKAS